MKKQSALLMSVLSTVWIITFTGCKKDSEVPSLATSQVTMISATEGTTGGNVLSAGGSEVTARGVCWSTSRNPTTADNKTTDGTGTGTFSSNITGLSSDAAYYVRAYATNSSGTAYGNEVTFVAHYVTLASVTTTAIASSATTYAVATGMINNDGGSAVTQKGICWSTSNNPTTDDNKVPDDNDLENIIVQLTSLAPGTTYFIRAYAINIAGVSYGSELSFTTALEVDPAIFNKDLTYGSVSDVDGNEYRTIQIGNQTWMAENLRTTKYNDGEDIPTWNNSVAGDSYGWYNNDASANKSVYGALYTWNTVQLASLCPAGWHVPTAGEWTIFRDNLGGESAAGGKIKESETSHWAYPNTDATNSTGWTGLPGGIRVTTGEFAELGFEGIWWTTEEVDPVYATCIILSNSAASLESDMIGKSYGASVRCVKDY